MHETYEITVGESGNEVGHVYTAYAVDDAKAVRLAKLRVRPYKGDGWYIVKDYTGREVDRGGRQRL